MNPFDVWAPVFRFRAPFSGDVTQEIAPRVLSPEIEGDPHIEHRVQTEVASYGKQLGKILEALQVLSEKAEKPLPEIEELIKGVEHVKETSTQTIRDNAKAAMQRLKDVDESAWREIIAEGKD